MVKQTGKGGYRLWIEPEAHARRDELPGKIRQRAKKQIERLRDHPRPDSSRVLNTEGLGAPDQVEIRRVRMENWRIVYAVNDEEKWVWVLSIRQRPPYDYDDLADLASMIGE